MVYSFVKAKLLSDNYFDLDDISNDSTFKDETIIALEEATLAIQSFDMITDLIIEDALRQEDDGVGNDDVINQKSKNFPFVSKVSAMNLWDPTLQEIPPVYYPTLKEGSPATLEISEEEKVRRVSSLYRNAPKGSKAQAFKNLTQTLQADTNMIKEAVVDLGEVRSEYHNGNLTEMEYEEKVLQIAIVAGDVALFGLDVATGPIPTSLGLRILARSILTVKGVDAFLAVGEGVTIAMGDEYGRAGFAGAREGFDDLLTIISIGDIATGGISSITDPTKAVGTFKFVVSQALEEDNPEEEYIKPNILVFDLESSEKKGSLQFYYTPNIEEMVLEEDIQRELARDLRVEMLNNVEEKLSIVMDELVSMAEQNEAERTKDGTWKRVSETPEVWQDNRTGLYWNARPEVETLTWSDAYSYCENLEHWGKNTWRLPSLEDYMTAIDNNMWMGTSPEFTTSYQYWTSTEFIDSRKTPPYDQQVQTYSLDGHGEPIPLNKYNPNGYQYVKVRCISN